MELNENSKEIKTIWGKVSMQFEEISGNKETETNIEANSLKLHNQEEAIKNLRKECIVQQNWSRQQNSCISGLLEQVGEKPSQLVQYLLKWAETMNLDLRMERADLEPMHRVG